MNPLCFFTRPEQQTNQIHIPAAAVASRGGGGCRFFQPGPFLWNWLFESG